MEKGKKNRRGGKREENCMFENMKSSPKRCKGMGLEQVDQIQKFFTLLLLGKKKKFDK